MQNNRRSLVIAILAFLLVGLALHYGTTRNGASVENYGLGDAPGSSQSTDNQPVASNPNNMQHRITLTTNQGEIVFETYDADAPKAVRNFIDLAGKGYYDNVIFHRVIKGFMIQGGDGQFGKLPNVDSAMVGRGGPGTRFEDELNPNSEAGRNGYRRGTVAMANSGPDTNGSQFFIMHQDYPLPLNYTIFGKVVSGMEVVDKIANSQTGPGDRPVENSFIQKVKVEEIGD